MTRKLRPARDSREAKGIRPSVQTAFAPSPTVASEIGEAFARVLRCLKAEAIAEHVGVGRSRCYELAGHPNQVPVEMLSALASLDPDPEFLARVAHALLVEHAALAARRRAAGQQSITLPSPQQGRLW